MTSETDFLLIKRDNFFRKENERSTVKCERFLSTFKNLIQKPNSKFKGKSERTNLQDYTISAIEPNR